MIFFLHEYSEYSLATIIIKMIEMLSLYVLCIFAATDVKMKYTTPVWDTTIGHVHVDRGSMHEVEHDDDLLSW